jgi:carbon-monoxide dehydrogenase large subunit
MVGARVKRVEDPRLITGQSTYVDDIRLVDLLYAAVVRSPIAHGRIKSIDVSQAQAAPGVVAVYTARDLHFDEPLPNSSTMAGVHASRKDPLCAEKVRMVGDPIAFVVAESRYAARDAAELVEADYDELPAVVDVEQALQPGAGVVWDNAPGNEAFRKEVGDKEATEAAFRSAHRTVSLRMVNQRLVPNPMETRGVVARWERGPQQLTVWSSSQIPHLLRTNLAAMLALPEHRVRVIVPEVGGGFGCKLNIYAEEALTARAAMLVNRPVKWIEDRRESFAATTHGRGQVDYVDLALDSEGRIVGLRCKIIADLGAYAQVNTEVIPTLSNLVLSGCYDIPALYSELIAVYTTLPPTDAYRGAGRPEGVHLVERVVDVAAREAGIDPAEFRRKNFVPKEKFPFPSKAGVEYDSGDYEPALDRALEIAGYAGLREEQRRVNGDPQGQKLLGIGLSSYIELSGFNPAKDGGGIGWESSTVRFEPSGKVTVLTGVSPHGQGQETTFAQIVSDEFGVPLEDVIVVHGDTATVQYGMGTYGSRGTAVGGAALMRATDRVREKAKRIAAHLLEASVEDIVYNQGELHVEGAPDRSLTIKEVAKTAYLQVDKLPQEIEPGLEATAAFDPTNFTWPFGTHLAVVEIDRETGDVELKRMIAVDDCGRIISPLLVAGQVHGGLVQGIGQALWEGAQYDENGQPLTGTLMDYALPIAADLPRFELDHTETPTPVNPLGVKGVGEAGTIGATPAVVNAVVDALAHLGVKDIDMPITSEKVWRILQQAPGAAQGGARNGATAAVSGAAQRAPEGGAGR